MVALILIASGLYLAVLGFSWYWVLRCGGDASVLKTRIARVLYWHGVISVVVIFEFVVWMLASAAGHLLVRGMW